MPRKAFVYIYKKKITRYYFMSFCPFTAMIDINRIVKSFQIEQKKYFNKISVSVSFTQLVSTATKKLLILK